MHDAPNNETETHSKVKEGHCYERAPDATEDECARRLIPSVLVYKLSQLPDIFFTAVLAGDAFFDLSYAVMAQCPLAGFADTHCVTIRVIEAFHRPNENKLGRG